MSHPPHSQFSRARKLTARCAAVAVAASLWTVTSPASATTPTTEEPTTTPAPATKKTAAPRCEVAFTVKVGKKRKTVRKTVNRRIKMQRGKFCNPQRKTRKIAKRALGKPCVASVVVSGKASKQVARKRTNNQRKKVMRQHGNCRTHQAKQRRANLKNRAMKVARAQIGDPYRYGAAGPHAFDCSGLTSYAYARAGKAIPRTTGAQRSAARNISRKQARVGDLVFFHGGSGVYHVGLYAGGNKVLHSPRTGSTVRYEKIWTSAVSFGRA